MKRILLLILLIASLLSSPAAFSQNSAGSITGRIFNADGTPAYVTVELKKLKKIISTDNNGKFKFRNLPPASDTLIISSVESRTYFQAVMISKNEEVNLGDIHLTFNIAQLQNVEVKGRIAHSYKSDYSFLGTKTQTALIDLPQSISTITKEMIEDKMEFTLKDAADAATGLNQYSGYDEYTIRGFKAENARMINGLRGYNTTFTSAMLV